MGKNRLLLLASGAIVLSLLLFSGWQTFRIHLMENKVGKLESSLASYKENYNDLLKLTKAREQAIEREKKRREIAEAEKKKILSDIERAKNETPADPLLTDTIGKLYRLND